MRARITFPRAHLLGAALAAALAIPCAACGRQGPAPAPPASPRGAAPAATEKTSTAPPGASMPGGSSSAATRETGAAALPAAIGPVSRAGEGGNSWLVGGAAAALILLLAAQGAVMVLLGRTRREIRTLGTRLSIRERGMNNPVHPTLREPAPAPAPGPGPIPAPEPAPEPEPIPAPDPFPAPEPAPGPEPIATLPEPGPTPVPVPPTPDPDPIRDPEPPLPAWPGGSHALYERARARLAELQGERGEKDRARLAAAAARFERRKAWVLALHEAWENEVDFAYLDLLQKPGVGAVRDPYVMVYPLSEHDWKATREELRRLARHIDDLPDEGHPQWPALLPRTALRSSVDFDLRVQPPQGTPPAAELHARRLLSTLLVNLKTLQRARVELGQLVQWVVEAAPAAEARPADVSPQVLAVLDAVCAAGRAAAEREAEVDAAMAALEAADDGNFAAVRAAEDGAEKLEQRYRAFLKMLFRVVDGTDRARALHAEALADGAAGDPWLAGWGKILDELDDLLVRRLLGGRLEIEPIACEPGQALDTDLHNPLGAERVQGVERDQVWRVESRGFAYAEDGARRVVRPVDVIVAVPA